MFLGVTMFVAGLGLFGLSKVFGWYEKELTEQLER